MIPQFIVFKLTSDNMFTIRGDKDNLNMIVKDLKTNKMQTASVDLTLARQAEEGETQIVRMAILEMLEKFQPTQLTNTLDALKLSVWIYAALKSKML